MVRLEMKTNWVQIHTAFFGVLALLTTASASQALTPDQQEKSLLSSCEEKLCRQILDKTPPKGRLRCNLEKTWGKKDIKLSLIHISEPTRPPLLSRMPSSA